MVIKQIELFDTGGVSVRVQSRPYRLHLYPDLELWTLLITIGEHAQNFGGLDILTDVKASISASTETLE